MAKTKGDALKRTRPALEPVVECLLAEARTAAEQIGKVFASISAISATSRQFTHEADMVGAAVAKLMNTPLIEHRKSIETPEAVIEMLAPLADKGPSSGYSVPTYVYTPHDYSAMGLLAGNTARQAVG